MTLLRYRFDLAGRVRPIRLTPPSPSLRILLGLAALASAWLPWAAPGARAQQADRRDGAEEPYAFFRSGTKTVTPAPGYRAGGFGKAVLGSGWRELWAIPVEVPVIDLGRTAGGLTPDRLGGGKQTRSLHLRGGDGKQYMLRSVDKYADRTVAEGFRNTWVEAAVQDQTSAIHPYAAFVLPPLAEAAGILHTSPTLVYVPDDPRLGEFRDDFAGMLALFESRPDEDQSDEARFGYAKNVVGTEKLLEELQESSAHQVDQRAYARARLFDLLIGDWDRHQDNWRWAEFEENGLVRYRAIPRDRDFTMFRFGGLVSALVRHAGRPEFRKFTHFDDAYGDLYGLTYQGSKLDLRLAYALDRRDWTEIAEEMRAALTDRVIEDAVREGLPAPVHAHSGQELVRLLKARRDELPAAAAAYYDLLARAVDVVGSDEAERFEVTRLDDRRTELVVRRMHSGDADGQEIFRRTFDAEETDELRLYGLGGDDHFLLTGEAEDGLMLRVIGGDGEDRVEDRSVVNGGATANLFYDTRSDRDWELGPSASDRRSNAHDVNEFEMRRIERDYGALIAAPGYNSEDGFFLGAGVRITRLGFRAVPFAARHELKANYAARTGGYNVGYEGVVNNIVGRWDGELEAKLRAPNKLMNFYGYGNDTPERGDNPAYARARRTQFIFMPALARSFGPFDRLALGGHLEYTDPDLRAGQPFTAFPPGLPADAFDEQAFAGVQGQLEIDRTDSVAYPKYGFRWLNAARYSAGVYGTSDQFTRLTSELSLFHTLPLITPLTFALRVGGGTNFGDFPFFHASTLGGKENLRGFPRWRFYGHSNLFANAETRLKLFPLNLYLVKGDLGLLGFIDHGRVWAGDDRFNDLDQGWHQGYGGGVWFAPFNQIVVSGEMGFSEEGQRIEVNVGFLF